jgi:hypothetical protein
LHKYYYIYRVFANPQERRVNFKEYQKHIIYRGRQAAAHSVLLPPKGRERRFADIHIKKKFSFFNKFTLLKKEQL